MPALLLFVRADWRRRWRALAALTVLVGVTGGVALTAAAGARRTSTSLERLAAVTLAADPQLAFAGFDGALLDEIRRLPSVERVSAATIAYAIVDGVGRDIGLAAPRSSGIGVDVERELLVRGRRAAQDRGDEVTLNETTSRMTGADAGDTLVVHTLSPEQYAAEDYFPPQGPDLELHVVGVTRGVDDAVGREDGTITGTPALYERLRGQAHEFAAYLGVHLRPDVTMADFERELSDVMPPGQEVDVVSLEVRSKSARRTLSALAAGLVLFAAAAGLIGSVVAGQALGRHIATAQVDDGPLRAVGMTRGERRRALAATAVPAVLLGSILAAVLAAVVSPVTPIGLARHIEPAPGLHLDWPVLLIGALAVCTAMGAVSLIAASWMTRQFGASASPRPWAAAGLAARAGAPPAVVNGVGLALDERGAAAPVKSALGGVVASVLVAVALVTFSSSLDRLVASPERWGYGWDFTFNFTSDTVEAAADELLGDADLSAVGRWDAGATVADGRLVRAFGLTPLKGSLGFTLRAGRQPALANEAVVGPATAAVRGVDIGGSLSVGPPGGSGAIPVAIVGIALFPESDEHDFTDAVGFAGSGFGEHAGIPAAFEASQVVARVAPGADVDDVLARLRQTYEEPLQEARPRSPADVNSLSSVRPIPRWLLVFVAVLGVASLLHILRSTISRRRVHLAMLRVLGMTGRQLLWCATAQALTVAGIAVVVGVPLGLVAGQLVWGAVAESIDVAPDPRLSAVALGAVAVATGLSGLLAAASAAHAMPRLSRGRGGSLDVLADHGGRHRYGARGRTTV